MVTELPNAKRTIVKVKKINKKSKVSRNGKKIELSTDFLLKN